MRPKKEGERGRESPSPAQLLRPLFEIPSLIFFPSLGLLLSLLRYLLLEDGETGDVLLPLVYMKAVFEANYSRKLASLKHRLVPTPPAGAVAASASGGGASGRGGSGPPDGGGAATTPGPAHAASPPFQFR